MNVAGSCRIDGTFAGPTCTVTFNGTGTQYVRGGGTIRFGNWTIANTTGVFISPFCGVRVPGIFTINPSCGLTLSGNSTLYLGGSYFNNGSFGNGAGTVVFNGTSPQSLTGGGFSSFGNLVIDNPAGCNGFDGNDINGNFTINTGARFNTPAFGTITIGGDFTNNGTFADTAGTTVFDGSTGQSIDGGSNTLFNNLTVDNPNGLTLNVPGRVCKKLHLKNGNLNSGGNLTIVSNDKHTGLVDNENGTVNGDATMERFALAPGYHYFSSEAVTRPVSEFSDDMSSFIITYPFSEYGTPAGLGMMTTPFPTFYKYDETLVTEAGDSLGGWQTPTTSAETMPTGRGYAVNLQANAKVDISGVFHNGNVSYSGLTRGNGQARGWNLVGNPYPSPVLWSQVSKTNVQNAIYFFKPETQYTGEYFSHVNGISTGQASDTIAAMQGVFVRVNNIGTGQLDFSNAARVTEYRDPIFFSTGTPTSTTKNGMVRLNLEAPNGQDAETVVYFEQGATSQFDADFDAYLFNKNPNMPTVWTSDADGSRTINGFEPLTSYKVIPVRVDFSQSGQHTFRGLDMWYFDSTATVLLEDAQTNALHNLTANNVYQFQASAGEDTARFKLHFLPGIATGLNSLNSGIADKTDVSVYPNPAQTYFVIEYQNAGNQQRMELYNSVGQTVWSGQTNGTTGEVRVQTDRLPSGVYVLRVATENGFVSEKIIIN